MPVLDHGFVGLVDCMGSDAAVVQSARVSYGAGTKTVREDRGLIRYLMRHQHMSPFEMAEVKLHLKLPIFVVRQLIRHRTANVNEYSGRYSEMSNEFYVPEKSVIMGQASDNKQGRGGEIDDMSKDGVRWLMGAAHRHSYDAYRTLLGDRDDFEDGPLYEPYNEEDPLFATDYPGIAREIARGVLPLSNYTELYWKQDLRNLLHLLKLRADPHAQYEIRVYADAIYQFIKPLFPLVIEAWEDYSRDAKLLSRMEINLLLDILQSVDANKVFISMIETSGGEEQLANQYGMSVRELRDFVKNWLE